jgi:hypothetical protein
MCRASAVQFTRAFVAGLSSTTAVAQPVTVMLTATTIPNARMVVYSTALMAPRPSRRALPVLRLGRCLGRCLIWSLVGALPACATNQEWIYEKPRGTPAQLDHDKAACRKTAPSRGLFKTLEAEKVGREAFNRCMESRGYRVKVAPLP